LKYYINPGENSSGEAVSDTNLMFNEHPAGLQTRLQFNYSCVLELQKIITYITPM